MIDLELICGVHEICQDVSELHQAPISTVFWLNNKRKIDKNSKKYHINGYLNRLRMV